MQDGPTRPAPLPISTRGDVGFRMAIQLSYLEKDIEDLLEQNCRDYLGLTFLTRQFKTPAGVVDVIAKHPQIKNTYYVVEIKKGAIDVDAYIQAVRYATWLNSERAKAGRRIFIPVLIGDTLRDDLVKVCEYLESDEHSGYGAVGKVFYRLFNFSPLYGVAFHWFSKAERAYRQSLHHYFSHGAHLLEIIDDVVSESVTLKLASKESVTAQPALTLVKTNGDAA